MPTLTLAPLTLAQVPAAVALDQQSLGGVWSQAQYTLEINNPISTLLGCYTPDAQTPLTEIPLWGLGCSWGIGAETHITLLAVSPEKQGQGLGTLLLWALLKLGLQQGRAWATLEVEADNQAALGLYQKFGFQEAGQRPKYYPSGTDALILWSNVSKLDLSLSPTQGNLQKYQWQLELDPNLEAINSRGTG
ncbi:GNAT family N-acetyltransferase [Thermosynechococcaceae cyanobacterium BACA0444]|uniref:GNAT family N-acetyltransferase n=1 Tax=Pseudocalidococcus azoricus BACA0444 TaxID=2918990 RepID=A0AAE4FTS6_9CYAN|nr:GNAT family N-acetyltransferase [Pseudocalidococcus azoricus]MDS3862051.1 GNAT family N-acetyltransferase [Pseudocalidococcus azoricus BACA0444]